MRKIKMRQMRKKQSGTIAAVTAGGKLSRRIRDMGLIPGILDKERVRNQ